MGDRRGPKINCPERRLNTWQEYSRTHVLMGKPMKRNIGYALCLALVTILAFAATTPKKFEAGKKAKITGMIQSRNGDSIAILEKKTNTVGVVNVSDSTKFDRKKGTFKFRRAEMDVTAMVPGLTIDAEGVGNAKGQLDASKVSFSPDDFAIEVAEEKQITANQAAAAQAQSTANQGVAGAAAAQSSANQAQTSANTAQSTANAAGDVAVMDADAISMVNKRVSDLGDYKTVVGGVIWFPTGHATLASEDKKMLDQLAKDAMGLDNYMIEVAGYASSTGTKEMDQKLSDARATAVVTYLRNSANVPMRRFLVPAGYGASHPAVSNTDSEGRQINQRVDVKVIVNKGLNESM
jgi:outer membrane protein OmpA-like peptidoglycan-associated protein